MSFALPHAAIVGLVLSTIGGVYLALGLLRTPLDAVAGGQPIVVTMREQLRGQEIADGWIGMGSFVLGFVLQAIGAAFALLDSIEVGAAPFAGACVGLVGGAVVFVPLAIHAHEAVRRHAVLGICGLNVPGLDEDDQLANFDWSALSDHAAFFGAREPDEDDEAFASGFLESMQREKR